jgi:hypothetical protein
VTDVDSLIAALEPRLDPQTYAFVIAATAAEAAVATVTEREGITSVVPASDADETATFLCRRIELGVNTELEVVGFLARISAELAAAGIAVNPMAGYHHDHLFVPSARAEEALTLLETLSEDARTRLGRADGANFYAIADGLWVAEGPVVPFFTMPYGTRMTVAILECGDLFIHSPIALTESLERRVKALGRVSYLIAPNKLHHLFMREWLDAFPQAQAFTAPGVDKKLPGVTCQPLDMEQPPWRHEIAQLTFTGSKVMAEVVFFHRASKTLIVADLIENFDPQTLGFKDRLLARITGILAPVGGMPRDWRATFRGPGRVEARRCVEAILDWHPERVVLAHGNLVPAGGHTFVSHALAPFLR